MELCVWNTFQPNATRASTRQDIVSNNTALIERAPILFLPFGLHAADEDHLTSWIGFYLNRLFDSAATGTLDELLP
ncbi:hypothetical protein AAFF_G00203010 [Aldrovandia affinis]|uniref:Uncharacterized protein n=1 Tax=Aldrovandia affinis TaxID=143900 RepID=A0AAD7SX74_9TELE|nr:hypothetical protein AAFF_G00203010 [Aldrovandia affinis]